IEAERPVRAVDGPHLQPVALRTRVGADGERLQLERLRTGAAVAVFVVDQAVAVVVQAVAADLAAGRAVRGAAGEGGAGGVGAVDEGVAIVVEAVVADLDRRLDRRVVARAGVAGVDGHVVLVVAVGVAGAAAASRDLLRLAGAVRAVVRGAGVAVVALAVLDAAVAADVAARAGPADAVRHHGAGHEGVVRAAPLELTLEGVDRPGERVAAAGDRHVALAGEGEDAVHRGAEGVVRAGELHLAARR